MKRSSVDRARALFVGGQLIAAALLLRFGGVPPANAQFFDFQRSPASIGENYHRQRMHPPEQGYGYGVPQPGYRRPDLEQPRYEPRSYEPSRRYEPRRTERRRKFESRSVEPREVPQEAVTKAPPPRKPDIEPGKKIVVLGDSMADWLAFGLEEALSDSSDELGVVRRHHTPSGLIQNELQDYDWVQGAHEVLAKQKADFIVVMIGMSDRRTIRDDQSLAKTSQPAQKSGEAQQKPGNPAHRASETPNPEEPERSSEPRKKPTDPAGASAAADVPRSETERSGPPLKHQFRSEKWAELYAKRMDQFITELKRKSVPVIWVGLPPIRGSRAQAEIIYLNDHFKGRAEKAGIVFVDVWDGFSDDDGDFANYGPDVAGQVRRLRTGDGLHFTKAGARKLAHYVEREIRRLMSRETSVALPGPTERQKPTGTGQPRAPAPRPVAGPVIPLTGPQLNQKPEPLLGSEPETQLEPIAAKTLIKGEPLESTKGRADDFSWPPGASEHDLIDPTEPVVLSRPIPPGQRVTEGHAAQKRAEQPDHSRSRQTNPQRPSRRSRQ